MKPHPKPPCLDRLLQQWQQEHRELERVVGELRWWSSDSPSVDRLRFIEMADRLTLLRDHLFEHFDREVEIGWELPPHSASPAEELEASHRQAADDHQQLLERLDQLIGRLRASPLPFDSWQDALDELDLFLDSLDEHEEQEETSFQLVRHNESVPDPS